MKDKITPIKSGEERHSPVAVFLYNRPEHSRRTLVALEKNEGAKETDVFIFCDGPKDSASKSDKEKIAMTRSIAKEMFVFKTKTVVEMTTNKGLASSIVDGVTDIVNRFGTVIVLEDDIVAGKYFLNYMNTALNLYENEKKVFHITGWHNPTIIKNSTDSFFYPLMDCWSWGTWKDRWQHFEKNPQKLVQKFSAEDIRKFNVDGLVPNKWGQVLGNLSGINNTWAIFWYATVMEADGLCLAPCNSLVKNIGFDNTGIHSKSLEHYEIKTSIEHEIKNFPSVVAIDENEYSCLKVDYKKRFRFDRYRQAIKKLTPNFLLCLRKRILGIFHK